jgi:hypothetical protein
MARFTPIIQAARDHALTTGLFALVNRHEPEHPQVDNGLIAAIWAEKIRPDPASSGLAVTSARFILATRIYSPTPFELDEIDPAVLDAVDVLFQEYGGDFTLGGLVTNIDLMQLDANAGYVRVGAEEQIRVMTITLPMVIADVWEQVA